MVWCEKLRWYEMDHANNLYTNWLNYYVYQVTPYDLDGTETRRSWNTLLLT